MHVCICMYACVHEYMYTCVSVCMYVCTYVYVCVCACMCVFMCTYIYTLFLPEGFQNYLIFCQRAYAINLWESYTSKKHLFLREGLMAGYTSKTHSIYARGLMGRLQFEELSIYRKVQGVQKKLCFFTVHCNPSLAYISL